jgi:hypothetical protein
LGAKTRPVARRDHRCPQRTRKLGGAIRAAAVDDDDFIGPVHALQAGLDIALLILRNDGDREAWLHVN